MVNLAGNFFGKFYSGQILTAIPGNSRSNLTCHCSAETEASFEVFAGDYLCIAGAGIRPRGRAKLSCRLSRAGNGNHGRWHIPDLRRKRIYGLPSGQCRDNRVRKSYPAKKQAAFHRSRISAQRLTKAVCFAISVQNISDAWPPASSEPGGIE